MNSDIQIDELKALIRPLFGKPNCRKRVGHGGKSLRLGFGRKIPNSNPNLREPYYGEWELGSYNCGWRVFNNQTILCGSNDPVDSAKEIDDLIQEIELGCITDIQQPIPLDVRVIFENGLSIDFLSTTSYEDEAFHIFCPQHQYIEFKPYQGWRKGLSNVPWTA